MSNFKKFKSLRTSSYPRMSCGALKYQRCDVIQQSPKINQLILKATIFKKRIYYKKKI